MSEQTENKLPVEVAAMLNPGQASVNEEARQQVSQLRDDANNMLMQLMLEQKAKLNEMVQQLQNPEKQESPESKAPLAQNAQEATSNPKTDPVAPESVEEVKPPEANVPLGDVAKLQQNNMVHLDAVIDRINATMQSSMNIPATEEVLNSGENNHGAINTDI